VSTRPLILASSSPRRRELLGLSGLGFEVRPAAVDETARPGESPEAFARRMSHTKAGLVAGGAAAGAPANIPAGTPANVPAAAVIIGADTIVVLDDETLAGDEPAAPSILGKPSGPGQAVEMLQRLRARSHRVLTAVSVVDTATGAQRDDLVTAGVPMRHYSDDEIRAYVATGNPLDKAGAYAIQFAGFQPVDLPRFHDCFATVMGLPVCSVLGLLAQAGVEAPLPRPAADCHHFDPGACPIYPLINRSGGTRTESERERER
jgi:MAF protein